MKDTVIEIVKAASYTLVGIAIGCIIMYSTHREMYSHYYKCQEKVLMDSLAEMKDLHVACFSIKETKNLIRGKK